MLSKSQSIVTNFRRDIFLTNSARDGWGMVLKTINPKSKILLPSYIGITEREGSGIYDPVTKLNLSHDFYMLNDDLTISIDALESYIEKETYSLILIVHYFGFKNQNMKQINELCRKHNILVVEDCAHLFNFNYKETIDSSSISDYVFYSLHKYFPVKSGGLLVKNNSKIKCKKKIFKNQNNNLNLLQYNIPAIASKRLKNFKNYETLLRDMPGVKIFKNMNDGDIPHSFPLIVENNLREKLYFYLLESSITTTALYYQLIKPLSDEKYLNMQYISNNILNLPLHQDIDENDIISLVDKIREFFKPSL